MNDEEASTILRRYTFKLYPGAAQTAALGEQSRMMAQLWNALLQRNEDLCGPYRRSKSRRDRQSTRRRSIKGLRRAPFASAHDNHERTACQ